MIQLLKTRKALEILELFLDHPESEFYQAGITKKLKISRATLIKWLKELTENDYLKTVVKGGKKWYRLNIDNPVVKQLKILLTVSKIYEVVKPLKGKKIEIYLYGSSARGEDTEKSDIDLLIIGEIPRKELVELIEKIKKNIKKTAKPVIFNPLEYSMLARKDRVFYENIEKNKIRLL